TMGSKHLKTTRQSPLVLDLQSVVIRGGFIVYQMPNQIWIGWWRNHHQCLQKPFPSCANVRGGKGLFLAQCLLKRNVPLQRERQPQIGIKRIQTPEGACGRIAGGAISEEAKGNGPL